MVTLKVNGTKMGEKTVDFAKDYAATFSPIRNLNNTFHKETREISKKVSKPNSHNGFDLDELIDFLSNVRKQFGNMKVLYFNGKTNCFSIPQLNDIDVVKEHFTISSNMSGQTMNFVTDKALSFFHC